MGYPRRIPLTALRPDEEAIIISIGANPKPGRRGRGRSRGRGFIKRLMDMGLTPGTQVKVVKTAPFRGPVEILVRGSRLALGRGMAERILVERIR
ncbi:ferrous iron transport protein A [Candidatus Bathyarchaeota archaeon]|nr:MAG: ferrous iron transport protein A [Candidatus Bathyarchaeota archaeon]